MCALHMKKLNNNSNNEERPGKRTSNKEGGVGCVCVSVTSSLNIQIEQQQQQSFNKKISRAMIFRLFEVFLSYLSKYL